MRDVYVDENLSSRGYEVNRRISPGFFPQKHWHEGVELLIVHSGVVEFYCDDRRELVCPGEVYLLNGSRPHCPRIVSRRFDRTVLHFRPELASFAPAARVLNRVQRSGMGEKLKLPGDSLRRLTWAVRQLADLTRRPVSQLTIEGLMGLVVAELEAASDRAPGGRPAILDAIVAYMEGNPDSTESVSDLAHRFAISRRTVYNLFNEYLGCTPKQFWLRARIEHGCRLLKETPWTVESIARHTGFGSLRGFQQAFQRIVGVSPSEFRSRYL